jgi:predicted nuclease of predicted toxin-antitoxin system
LKFVFDANISGHAVRRMKEAGHDVLWAADMRGDMTDRELMDIARGRQSALVTADPSFGEDFLGPNEPHPPIVRLVGMPPTLQGEALVSLLEMHSHTLVPGAILTGGKDFIG